MRQILTSVLWAVFGLCAVLTVYPYAIYPLILRRLRTRPIRTEQRRSNGGREFALLFCAYNEAGALRDKLRNISELRARFPHLEVLAYDDCSSDGTAAIIDGAGLGISVVRGRERTGKAHGMKLLAAQTSRDYLIFTDANVELDPCALDALLSDYADPDVGGVCGVLEYRNTDTSTAAKTGGLYWCIDKALKSLESRSGNVMGAAGAVFSIRRSLYPDFPDSLLDDLTVSMAVIFDGRRLIEDSRVLAHEPMVESRGDDVRRRIRISTRAFHTHLWLRPKLRGMCWEDRWRYWSHRYVRWQGAFLLIVGGVSGVAALGLSTNWVVAALVLAGALLALFVGARMRSGILASIAHIVTAMWLTALGVIRACSGHTMTTWNPPTR